jgi:hypothetical protein
VYSLTTTDVHWYTTLCNLTCKQPLAAYKTNLLFAAEMTMLCKELLSHSSNFPAALLVLWNLTGGTGHVDNLEPYLASNAAFGMLFFALSSAFCDVGFRFMWFAGLWSD